MLENLSDWHDALGGLRKSYALSVSGKPLFLYLEGKRGNNANIRDTAWQTAARSWIRMAG